MGLLSFVYIADAEISDSVAMGRPIAQYETMGDIATGAALFDYISGLCENRTCRGLVETKI